MISKTRRCSRSSIWPDRRAEQARRSSSRARAGRGRSFSRGDPRREPEDGRAVHLGVLRLAHGNLLESELFGHEKGAFTAQPSSTGGKSWSSPRTDLLPGRDRGHPPELQMDLLRVLEQREFRRVGGSELIPINSRSSPRRTDLAAAIAEEALPRRPSTTAERQSPSTSRRCGEEGGHPVLVDHSSRNSTSTWESDPRITEGP